MCAKKSLALHQIWLQGRDNSPFADYFDQFEKYAKQAGGQYYLWDDKSIRELLKQYPCLLETYNSYEFWVMKVDLAKYVILYKYGGFLFDADTQPLRSPYPLMEYSHGGKVVVEHLTRDMRLWIYFGTFINNGFFYVPYPHNKLMKRLMENASCLSRRSVYSLKFYHVLGSVGPMYLMETIDRFKEEDEIPVIIITTDDMHKYVKHISATSWLKKPFDRFDGWVFLGGITLLALIYLAIKFSLKHK